MNRAIAMPRAAAPAVPTELVALLAWAGAALLARPLSVDLFVWIATAGFAAVAVWPFVRRPAGAFDTGDVLYLFTLYYVLSLLARGVGLLTFVDSPYLRELGGPASARFRDLVGQAMLHAGLGLAAVVAGARSPLGERWARTLERRFGPVAAPWRPSRLPAVTLALGAVGLAAALARVRGLGGLASAAANPMMNGTEGALGQWWLIALTEFAVVAVHVHLLGLLLRGDRRFLLHYFVLGIGLGAPLYLVSSSKFLLLRLLFLPWLFRHFAVKPVPMAAVVGGFAGFGALFPFFYAYRAIGLLGLDAFTVARYLQTTETPWLKLFNRSYGADSFVLVLLRTGDTVPYRWGGSLADLATFWIPRALWAAKPPSFGLEFPATYMPDMHWGALTYATSSLPGELWLNFALPGVLVGGVVLGAAMRAGHVLARRGPGGLLVYGYAFLTAMHLVEGCIASQLETFLTHLVPSLLALWLLAPHATETRRAA